MSDAFGEAAKRLAAFSAQALGWRPAEFWEATPAELKLAASTPDKPAESLTRDQFNQLLERESNG